MRRLAILFAAVMALSCATQPRPPIRPDDLHFKNLQVLPVNISKNELLDTMVEFSGALSVHCDHCHVKISDEPEKFEFHRDDKPEKAVARTMIRMTAMINKQYIKQVRAGDARVSCGTCHRGETVPPGFTPISAPRLPPT
ncbi:MAG TPA: c-type cytochrome [Thermoanaerobaculia bacterium]|nr:c-type cytochrome [Thermoanaerobaculia bacterium]